MVGEARALRGGVVVEPGCAAEILRPWKISGDIRGMSEDSAFPESTFSKCPPTIAVICRHRPDID